MRREVLDSGGEGMEELCDPLSSRSSSVTSFLEGLRLDARLFVALNPNMVTRTMSACDPRTGIESTVVT